MSDLEYNFIMKPIIIPALLPKSIKELFKYLERIQSFSNWVQIDIADGKFVNNETVSLEEIINNKRLLKKYQNKVQLEFHLMINEPEKILDNLINLKLKRVFVHFEAIKLLSELKKHLKKMPFELGLAINPNTEIDDFKFLTEYFNSYLFMTVYPGFQGQKFIPNVLDKIKKFKKMFPSKIVEIDGGVNEETAKLINLKVDYIVVGSYISKAENPEKNYQKLMKILND